VAPSINNTSATALNLGTVRGPEMFPGQRVGNPFDQDWYRFFQPVAGTFSVTIGNIHANGGDLWLRVFRLNTNGTLTDIADSTHIGGVSTQSTAVVIPPGSVIYVWVFGFNFAQGSFDLDLNFR
jgi:hypothetical protein